MTSFDSPHAWGPARRLRRGAWALFIVVSAGVLIASNASAQDNVVVSYRSLTAGDGFGCVLDSDGGALCWGSNGDQDGRLGNGPLDDAVMADALAPAKVLGGFRFIQISSGMRHSCGIVAGGAAYCWGANNVSQLGVDSDIGWAHQPVPVAGGIPFISISAGRGHTCAIDVKHRVHCWGLNEEGQLGNGTVVNSRTPVMIEDSLSYRSVSAGIGSTTCGVTREGLGFCWGSDAHGQVGDGNAITYNTTDIRLKPTAIAGGHRYESVRVGSNHTCGILTSGAAMCWGGAPLLGLARPDEDSYSYPKAVAGGLLFKQLDVGNRHTCGITTKAVLACWGVNTSGESGTASDLGQIAYVPQASAPGQFAQVSVAQGTHPHTCAITADMLSVHCFGLGDSGQLGNGMLSPNGVVNPVLVLTQQLPGTPATPVAKPAVDTVIIPAPPLNRNKPVTTPAEAYIKQSEANAIDMGSVGRPDYIMRTGSFQGAPQSEWYKVRIEDPNVPFGPDWIVTITLAVPLPHDYDMQLYEGPVLVASATGTGSTEVIKRSIKNTVSDDSLDLFVRIIRHSGPLPSAAYSLEVRVN